MNREAIIIKDVEWLVSSSEINQSDTDKLSNNLDNLLFSNDSDSKKFGVLLRGKIIPPLFAEINALENKISTLGNSRINKEKNSKLVTKKDILNDLLTNLFKTYLDFLNNSEEYKIFEDKNIEKIEQISQDLLNENLDEKNPFPEYYNKSNSDKVIKEIKEYYKRVFLNPTNILFVKTKLTQLLASLKSKISDVENEITVWNKRAEEYKKDLLSFSIEKSEEKDRAFDLYDCEMSGITNLKNYKKDLVRLYSHILEEYPFISSKPITISDVTVFGDSNIEIIKRIYLEFSDFIDKTATNETDFVKTFLDLPINHKINLIKGTLSDYAYFIRELKPFFMSKYKENAGAYNQWWSDRFLFSGKEKSRKEISNMISGLDSGRPASKRVATTNIVNFLSKSYNYPS
ncbi:MAG: hypothetical protein MUW56_07360 [Chryseobacterium sp.]|uniref:hypothetical protein n=1 Tax=Chryseobacterium sp. TaxID=1871047 RepID=UPI0025BD8F9C|nr:hypothetical protein [Chryseobacterium sp.]MCJ7933443.1 hypothetical protein [Chryseobacterium sp.]